MKKAPGQVSGRFMRYQYIFAPAGMLSSSMMRFRRSSPSSWCTAEISIPQESMPIIWRGGLLVCVFAIYYVLLQSLEGVEQQAALRQRLIFESRLMETQIAEQKKHSALMLEHMSELRRQRHDLRHQLAAICGLVNGLVITRLKLSAFVTTLATQFIFKGLVTGISKGFPYTSLSPNYADFGRGSFLGIPLIALLAVATLVLVWYILRYTVAGRKLLATGGSLRAAKMAAVNTDRMILIANIASGFFCGVAAVCTMSLNGMGQPTTGTDWMLYSFAVSVIGGTGLAGGVVCPAGLAIAVVLFVIIKNGLVLINANVYFEQTYLGLILLVACSLGVISDMIGAARRRREFRLAQAKKVKQPADAADEK